MRNKEKDFDYFKTHLEIIHIKNLEDGWERHPLYKKGGKSKCVIRIKKPDGKFYYCNNDAEYIAICNDQCRDRSYRICQGHARILYNRMKSFLRLQIMKDENNKIIITDEEEIEITETYMLDIEDFVLEKDRIFEDMIDN